MILFIIMSDSQKLKDIIQKVKEKSENVSAKAGEIQKTGCFVKELADISMDTFGQSPLSDYPDVYIDDFQAVLDNLGKMENQINRMSTAWSGVTLGTASAMATLSGVASNYYCRSNPVYTQFYSKFDEVVDRGQTKDQTILAIKRLGLDSTKEGQDAINLLLSAWNVHLQGVGISTSSLIPLREAIAKTLQAIQKKSLQSKIKDWILDIGKKVCYSHITSTELQGLQTEHDILRDKLSGSKSQNYSRDEERRLLRDGTLHLLKILNIIDINKLK